MSTQANPAPVAEIKANPVLSKSIATYLGAVAKVEIARDNMNNAAKLEATKHGYDKKSLTAILFASGLSDARTVSETVGFVFPKVAENRAALDKIMEHNAAQTDAKKRISKPVQLAIQRAEKPITVEEAQAQVEAKKTATRTANPPGGEVAKKSDKKKTAKEQEEEILTALSAAASLAKSYGYDRDDFNATLEEWQASYLDEIMPEASEGDDDDDDDTDSK